jgi:hypothetical protein
MRAGRSSPTALLVSAHRHGALEDDYYDPSNEHKALLEQSDGHVGPVMYRKLRAVHWRNVLSIFVTVVDYFLVYAAISLIGAFFPTKVIVALLSYNIGVYIDWCVYGRGIYNLWYV